jgi:hypothetical protein
MLSLIGCALEITLEELGLKKRIIQNPEKPSSTIDESPSIEKSLSDEDAEKQPTPDLVDAETSDDESSEMPHSSFSSISDNQLLDDIKEGDEEEEQTVEQEIVLDTIQEEEQKAEGEKAEQEIELSPQEPTEIAGEGTDVPTDMTAATIASDDNAIQAATTTTDDDKDSEDNAMLRVSIDCYYLKSDTKTNTLNDLYKYVEQDTQVTLNKSQRKYVRKRLRELSIEKLGGDGLIMEPEEASDGGELSVSSSVHSAGSSITGDNRLAKIQEINDEKAKQVRELNEIAESNDSDISEGDDDESSEIQAEQKMAAAAATKDAIFASVDKCFGTFDIKTNTFNDIYKSVEEDTQIKMSKPKRKIARIRLRELILAAPAAAE